MTQIQRVKHLGLPVILVFQWFTLSLFCALTILPSPVLAVAGAPPNTTIQGLRANTWYEVPNSKMSSVEAKEADYPGIWGNLPNTPEPRPSNFLGSTGVFLWSGAVFDSKRNRLVLWGGGHNAYYGNELYAFDLTTLLWARVTNPSPPTDWANCIAILSDGRPNSRHTYYNLAYLPSTDKFFSTPAGTTSCEASGLDNNTWSFDFSNKEWVNLNPATELYGNGKPKQPPGWAPTAAAYNPLDGKVYSVGPDGLFTYDVAGNRWDKLNSTALWEDRGAAVDKKRGLLVVVGRGEVVVYDLANQNYTPQFWDTQGDEAYNVKDKNNFRPGVNYDPVADRIVVWDGGAVHALNMDTRQWDDLAVAPQVHHRTGTYGRFRYSPRENAYVLVNDATENVLIYKLADNSAELSIIVQPVAVTVNQGQTATFSVLAAGSSTLGYQWRKNGVAINGATLASYNLAASDMADNAAVFDVVVSNASGSLISSAATLTIIADTVAPTVDAVGVFGANIVQVVFSEPVMLASAENITNYTFSPTLTVEGAVLASNGRVLLLTVSGLNDDTRYSLILNGITDSASIPNTIIAGTTINFVYRTPDDFTDGNADGWAPSNAAYWDVTADGGDNAYYLNTTNANSPGGGRLGAYSLLPANYGDFTFTAQARLGDPVGSNTLADYAVVFGFQDADNYYYAMFNNDQSATQIFKVVNGIRATLATASSDWLNDNLYHSIEVSRAGSAISVRFDGNLILSANDSTFAAGRVGVGSFNDSAYFDDVSVAGEASTKGGNSAPTAAGASIMTGENTQSVGVDAQVTDPDVGDTHTLSIVTQPSNGSAQVVNNKLVYTPASGFVGNDSFQFRASDSGNLSVMGTASVTVSANIGDGSTASGTSGGGGGGAMGPLFGLSLMLFAFWYHLFKGQLLITNTCFETKLSFVMHG